MGTWLVAAALLLIAGAAVVVSAMASSAGSQTADRGDACHVGGTTRLKGPRVPPGRGIHLVAGPAVLACGTAAGSSYELVGLQRSDAFCYSLDQPRQGLSEGGLCKPNNLPWASLCSHFCLDPIHGSEQRGDRLTRTVVTGQVPPRFSSVWIAYRYRGRWRHDRAAVARIQGQLARKLRQTDRFGLYAAVLPHCVGGRAIRVVGDDAGGRQRPTALETPPRSTAEVCDVGAQ